MGTAEHDLRKHSRDRSPASVGSPGAANPLAGETRVCDGTACHFGGGAWLAARLGVDGIPRVRCLGHCHAAPVFLSGGRVFGRPRALALDAWLEFWGEAGEPHEDLLPVRRASLASRPVLLRNLVKGALAAGVDEDLPLDEAAIVAGIAGARARAPAGARLPDLERWQIARATASPLRFVVANGAGSDPGAFADRVLLEEDPHAVLAGMRACAVAIGAAQGFVCVRAEFLRAQQAMQAAILVARGRGLLGNGFDVEVVSGTGAYVDGEEAMLLNLLEGVRGEPGIRHLEPARHGLFERPTVVEDVETFATLPWVLRTGRAPDTRVLSVSGAVRTPALVEAPIGTPLAAVIEQGCGGAAPGARIGMALVGGPTGHVVPASRLETPVSIERLPRLGHGGVVVLDDTVSPRALALHLFDFIATASCGACAPCRTAAAQLPGVRDRASLEALLDGMSGSVCRVGREVAGPIRELLALHGAAVFDPA